MSPQEPVMAKNAGSIEPLCAAEGILTVRNRDRDQRVDDKVTEEVEEPARAQKPAFVTEPERHRVVEEAIEEPKVHCCMCKAWNGSTDTCQDTEEESEDVT